MLGWKVELMVGIKKCENNHKEICLLYDRGLSLRKIANNFSVSQKPIRRILEQYNIIVKKEKYSLDKTFFNKIDTSEKAYILGLLYADGSVNRHNNDLKITLHKKDVDILNKINKIIKSNRPIGSTLNKEKKDSYRTLCITNKNIKNNLYKLGIIPNKTLHIRFPKFLKKEYIFHFIRGVFDGDGYFYIDKRHKAKGCFAIVGNKDFCKDINILLNKNNIKSKIYFNKTHKNSMEVRIMCINDIKNFLVLHSSIALS
jgi:hypothetical protein